MTDEERPEPRRRLPREVTANRSEALKTAIQQYGDGVERGDDSLLSSICSAINDTTLKEFDLEDTD